MKPNARLASSSVLMLAVALAMGCGERSASSEETTGVKPAEPPKQVPATQAEGQLYPDPLLTTPVTPEHVEKAKELDAYNLGMSAYLWGYPLVRMERVLREYTDVSQPQAATSYRAPLNRIGWATELATPDAKDMPAANNDTLYMSAVVQLDEPYVISVPDTDDRYYVINVFTTYHELEHYIGRLVTGTEAGRFALVPPGWTGTLPAGVQRLDVSTPLVWLWGRLHIRDGEPMEPVKALQAQFDLRPLSQLGKAGYQAPAAQLPALPDIAGDELGFFTHLGYAMQHNPVMARDEALAGQLERIGLTGKDGFDRSKLTPAQLASLKRALDDATVVALGSVSNTSVKTQGWDSIIIDGYGYNYPLRAVHSGPYLGGNMAKEAFYPSSYTDAQGELLSGANRYELRFSKAPPVDAFWSLTMYNADDKMLVHNPIDRYKVGSETPGVKYNDDGSFSLYVQREEPEGDKKANWPPSPEGNFFLVFRFYQPRQETLEGKYPLPEITKVQ